MCVRVCAPGPHQITSATPLCVGVCRLRSTPAHSAPTCRTLDPPLRLLPPSPLQAGAGLVADSVPESEYEETVNKSAALGRAIDLAEQAFVAADS